jgi:hypothetical protein
MPIILTNTKPDASDKIVLVLYGKTITGRILANELAPHIGLLLGSTFADYQTFSEEVGDYSQLYSEPWYFKTSLTCTPTQVQLEAIEKLAGSWGRYLQSPSASGVHSSWPHNCRSFVAYVIEFILKCDGQGLPGLGKEVDDKTKTLKLNQFATEVLAKFPASEQQ